MSSPTTVTPRSASLSGDLEPAGPVVRQIPPLSAEQWHDVAPQARDASLPVVVRGLFAAQAQSWSPARVAELWPDRIVHVTVDLPPHGVPYRESLDSYQKTMRYAEFLSVLESGRSCYLAQMSLTEFPALLEDLNLRSLRLGILYAANVWIGNRTRSGLHYDNGDNLFGQIYGRKRAMLVSPKDSHRLYPFADNPSKSQVDLDALDLTAFPRCAGAELWSCDVGPGDALFIPKGWWHHISSEGPSLSINCWHGNSLTDLERLRRFIGSGAGVVFRAVFDFFWHGLLRKPYKRRLFSPPPPGVEAYAALRRRFR